MTNFPPILPVELVVFDGVQLLDVAGPLQVLSSCNDLLSERGERLAYAPRVLSLPGGSVRSSSGLALDSEPLSSPRRPVDTLLVAGGFGVHAAARERALVDWIARRAGRARRVGSVCTGAFLLAEAGLLEGRRATTHWQHGARLAAEHPGIDVDCEPIFVEDGAVWTSAGVTAGMDMTLALVERDLGRELALAVARRLVVYMKRPGGQSQFSAALAAQESARFAELHEWVREHLDADLRVPALATRAGMSERNFARLYVAETGVTPAVMVERFRVEAARRALEGGAPLERAATAAGFGSTETLRKGFLRTVGIGPGEYRRRFSGATR